jgi:hypothetical protein
MILLSYSVKCNEVPILENKGMYSHRDVAGTKRVGCVRRMSFRTEKDGDVLIPTGVH